MAINYGHPRVRRYLDSASAFYAFALHQATPDQYLFLMTRSLTSSGMSNPIRREFGLPPVLPLLVAVLVTPPLCPMGGTFWGKQGVGQC